jgi:hypothetical protein
VSSRRAFHGLLLLRVARSRPKASLSLITPTAGSSSILGTPTARNMAQNHIRAYP